MSRHLLCLVNESLTTVSLAIAATTRRVNDDLRLVLSSLPGWASEVPQSMITIRMMTRKSLSFSRRIAAARPPCAKAQTARNGLSQKGHQRRIMDDCNSISRGGEPLNCKRAPSIEADILDQSWTDPAAPMAAGKKHGSTRQRGRTRSAVGCTARERGAAFTQRLCVGYLRRTG